MIDLLPTRIVRALGSEGSYSDAVSSVNKFNSRLLRERRFRLRLPFVDSQTHIIQTPTQKYLWRHPTQRLMPTRHDQVAVYARKVWHKKRPHQPASHSQSAIATNGISEHSSAASLMKNGIVNGIEQTAADENPRVRIRAGELGMSI